MNVSGTLFYRRCVLLATAEYNESAGKVSATGRYVCTILSTGDQGVNKTTPLAMITIRSNVFPVLLDDGKQAEFDSIEDALQGGIEFLDKKTGKVVCE